MKEALFYSKLDKATVRCELCPHLCKIGDNKIGICGVRQNRNGVLYSLVYGKIIASHVDPIEKKPLFHVHPGSRSFSIATVGCNFSCQFCQNSDISQMPKDSKRIIGETLEPKQVVDNAEKPDCKTIAYTYTEPTIFYEYAFDCAELARQKEIKNVFVTNGYISTDALYKIQPFLDAANVDLKSFDTQFYKKVVGGDLKHVLASLKLMKELGIWVEVTTLLIPRLVDSESQLKEIADFISIELGPETPWHVSRFYPQYNITDIPPTTVESVANARQIGLAAGLRYVYSGNIPGNNGESTYCYRCGTKVIERYGYKIMSYSIHESRCKNCNTVIDGIGM